MENFTFYNPTKLIFGKGTIANIGKEIRKEGLTKVLILAGSGSIKKNGVYDQVVNSLITNKIDFVDFFGVRPNPDLVHAEKALNTIREQKCDAILAVGGGSVIDEAKAISAGWKSNDIWSLFVNKPVIKRALPIFTVLTMSGTCSEMDLHAVLTNYSEKKKWAYSNKLLFPKVSIVDPEVQYSLPWHQTVNGGIDAMTHIMEFYFGAGGDEEITLSINEAMMRTIISQLDILQNDQTNYNARANLAWTATLGLNGVSSGMLIGEWAVHRIEHGISALHPEVAHGAGLAVAFPSWIKYSQNMNPNLFKRWAMNVWRCESIDEAVEEMKNKFSSWGAPVSMSELNIGESEFDSITKNALTVGEIGRLNKLSYDDIMNILKIAK